MLIRQFTILISVLLVSTNLLSQTPKKRSNATSWNDTTFIPVALNDTIKDNKVVAVEIGRKATIYVKVRPMIIEAKTNLKNDFVGKYYQRIIHFFDSASAKVDTVFIGKYYSLQHFEYLISQQLIDGNAKVYYKKQKAFVDTISHRLEKYGRNADRFFYLPDRRPFFAVLEYSGILEKDDGLTKKSLFDAYVKEGEKLQSIPDE